LSRGLIAAVVGVGAAVALGLVFYFDREDENLESAAVPAVSAPSETTSAAASDGAARAENLSAESAPTATVSADSETNQSKSDEAAPLETAAGATADPAALQQAALPSAGADVVDAPAPLRPSFDVVRIEQSGEGVIAGRAAPGCLVIVYDGDVEIGRVRADAKGNWVLILARALGPGTHELRLVAQLENGEELRAEQAAIIALKGPEDREVIAAASTHGLATGDAAGNTKDEPALATGVASSDGSGVADTQVASAEATLNDGEPVGADAAKPLVVLVPDAASKASKVLQGGDSGATGEGISDKGLVLNSIDYDEEGKALVAGRAEPGSKVVVYLDNEPLAAAQADGEGNWPAVLDKPIEPGLHKLRVDQVDDRGDVIARVETPFSRADLAADAFAEGAVVVQPGNSLWRISRRVYGHGIRYSVIYQANNDQIGDPDLIYPGQIFTIPKLQ